MKKILSFFLSVILIFYCFTVSAFGIDEKNFDFLEYTEEAISEFSTEIFSRVSSQPDEEANKGYDGTGMYISPYWTCTVDGNEVPAYGTLTYDYDNNIGVLQSFSTVWLDTSESVCVTLSSIEPEIENAIILPSSYGITPAVQNGKIKFGISKAGAYTVLINNDSMQYAFTLFVNDYTNEQEEIEKYNEKYGKENVLIFDKNYYEVETLNVENFDVIYFCRGSYFKAIPFENFSGVQTFLELNNKNNFIIDGYGTFDFISCDWKEVNPGFVNCCENCDISGLNFINPSHWTFYTYRCKNMNIKNITAIGYRTNSDGINICNSENITVENSFIRTGDDSFSVKTLNDVAPSENITFEHCISWSTKARSFGITGEVEADIRNVTFKNCAVIDRSAIWDNDRIGSLCIIVENGKGQIDGITFENIEIHNDDGRPINCTVYGDVTDCQIKNIVFKNIQYNGEMKPQLCACRNVKFFDKINGIFYQLLKRFNIENKFTEKYEKNTDNNLISVTFENVQSITKINCFLKIESAGNIELKITE